MDTRAFEPEAAGVVEKLKHLKVLVIDEHEITRRTLELVLTFAGAEVAACETQAEALAHLSVRPYDAVVTDEFMEHLAYRNGRAVLEGFPGPNTGVPVIGVTWTALHPRDVAHAAGMMVEIGGLIDPGGICAALEALHPGQRAAA